MTEHPQLPGAWASLNRLAWDVALDRLEVDLIQVEQMLGSEPPRSLEPWDEPSVPGPIPAELLPRAVALHRRQAVAAHVIAAAMSATRRHQAFTDRVSSSSSQDLPAPAYVDLTA